MNVWGDNKEGRPVDNCRIIEMLRGLDSNAASLVWFSRELAAMHRRIIDIIEALYKWDMKDNSCISDTVCKKAVEDSIETAASVHRKGRLNREDIISVVKKYGYEIKGEISPLEIHIATEE
jgi:uncharacterized protein